MNSPLLPASAPPIAHLRTRPVAVGHWRAFLAVARHLNFRAAAEELALTQSAVSRQIQALEDEVGVPLFLRHTRAVELTSAGGQLQRAVAPALERMDAAVRLVRQTAGRKSVAITTWASFASMWLIPRMEEFQRDNPDIDIRIDATDTIVDLETATWTWPCAPACPARRPRARSGCLASNWRWWPAPGSSTACRPSARRPTWRSSRSSRQATRTACPISSGSPGGAGSNCTAWGGCSPSAGCTSTTRSRSCRPRWPDRVWRWRACR